MKLIFLGCLSSSKYSETCENATKIIKLLDDEYQVLEDVPCCGAITFHVSSDEELRDHVEYVTKWFKEKDVKEIVTICAGCYKYLTTYYPQYITDFDIKTKHIIQLIAESDNLNKLNLKYEGKKLVVTYHDPCHLKTGATTILEEPRKILENIDGNLVYKDMDPNPVLSLCCGAGGGVYSSFKENSAINSPIIFENAKKTRAKLLLTSCPFCYTALKKAKEENKSIRIPVMKYEDFIIKLIEGVDPLA